ncbi:MAG: hypothetical protein VCA57_21435 [Pseudomonas sp.]|uniref:hypothetical protein n=1 Tax=Pseudomonas sp. TaxID=306 RepID=UPI0039821A95
MFSLCCAVAFSVLLWLIPNTATLHAEELRWGAVPIPGMFNLRDGEVTGGMLVEALQLLAARLPSLQMRYVVLPMSRVDQRISRKGKICSIGQLQTPERDSAGYFIPYVGGMPIQVLVRRQSLDQLLIEGGQVSLDWLFANPYLRGALSKGRVYPQPIRQRLAQALAEGSIAELGGSLGGENLVRMVSNHRLDYVFDYPLIHSEMMRDANLSDALVSVPLREHSQLEALGIYCPRTPWGQRMTGLLDQAIRGESANPERTLDIYRRWLPPQVFADYREQLLQFFRQRANAAPLAFD